ncbi:flagellar basal body rod protein FlgB [Paenibacillus sp. J31TS4]|uniref:flagellar basal body rod protein FlgB n=1 Tax=Paenibacillus sp. J31TS4 TaxID=2807195 RepID=UPI001B27DA12|nr:flagellar basal body rod protein FlgB [Paenibacillus sp. J31TS4]GIP36805.1 flagellar basal body rod protein FlgB [Paenibacillus sp. J31TS4]
MLGLNFPGLSVMERSLDAATLRQKVLANNIANVDTPYFKRSDVVFEELLQSQLQSPGIQGRRTDPRHFAFGSSSNPVPQTKLDESSAMNNNQNNVDIDSEMAMLAMNQLRYQALVGQVSHEFRMAKSAIGGSGQ